MNYEEFKRTLTDPYWCEGSPLRWQAQGIGLAHFALNGQVGMFNLSWLIMQRKEPPASAETYKRTDLMWVIMHSPSIMIRGLSMEYRASVMPLTSFTGMLREYLRHPDIKPCDVPGYVPWGTLYNLSISKELS